MISQPTFDIFAGSGDKDAMWLETVEGLNNAQLRMEAIAAQVPGRYFVFSVHRCSVLATTDTTENFVKMGNRTQMEGAA